MSGTEGHVHVDHDLLNACLANEVQQFVRVLDLFNNGTRRPVHRPKQHARFLQPAALPTPATALAHGTGHLPPCR